MVGVGKKFFKAPRSRSSISCDLRGHESININGENYYLHFLVGKEDRSCSPTMTSLSTQLFAEESGFICRVCYIGCEMGRSADCS